MRRGAGCTGNIESVGRIPQTIQLALPRIVKLSNWVAREFDVSLGPDGGRNIIAKISLGAKLRARRRAGMPIGDLAQREMSPRAAKPVPAYGSARLDRVACPFGRSERSDGDSANPLMIALG
jgi:hypothetical protein